jgi:DASS family divalent anion:Na+ symporter
VISWNSLLRSHGAWWSTFIWYAGILSFTDALGKAKFFDWLGKSIGLTVNFSGMDQITVLLGILFISVVVRDFFASSAAYVSSFISVLMAIGLASHLPSFLLMLILGVSSMMGSLLTYYGNDAAPILFGAGYVDQVVWWKTGHMIAILVIVIYIAIGLPIWGIMGIR